VYGPEHGNKVIVLQGNFKGVTGVALRQATMVQLLDGRRLDYSEHEVFKIYESNRRHGAAESSVDNTRTLEQRTVCHAHSKCITKKEMLFVRMGLPSLREEIFCSTWPEAKFEELRRRQSLKLMEKFELVFSNCWRRREEVH